LGDLVSRKIYALFGLVGPLIAFLFIGVSIAYSPWFRWEKNALSDLGHSVKSGVAPIFNFGLLLTGLLVILYAIGVLVEYAQFTGYSLVIAAFNLQLVAVFDEVYGRLHWAVSLLFFVSMGAASVIYALERRSYAAAIAFVIGLLSWILYWAGIYSAGVAVPETISALAILPWIISSAVEVYASE